MASRQMRRLLLILALIPAGLSAQTLAWTATTGITAQSGATATSTIQQPASGATAAYIDQVVVYCSVACTATVNVNGTGATTTAGTVTPQLPYSLIATPNVNFFTASNVGAGTIQGGIIEIPAGAVIPLCFSQQCGKTFQVILGTAGTAINNNISVVISAITGNSIVTWYGRSQ